MHCIVGSSILCSVLCCILQILANAIGHYGYSWRALLWVIWKMLNFIAEHTLSVVHSCGYFAVCIYHPGRETQNRWDYRCLYLVFYVHEYWQRKSVHVTQRWDTFTHTRFTNWDYTHTNWQWGNASTTLTFI